MKKILTNYLNNFEKLDLESIDQLLTNIDKKFIFEDPFNRTNGKKEFKNLLKKMFKKINNPSFKILEVFPGSHSHFVKWQFECKVFKKKISFIGSSEIFIKNRLVYKHIDYWDTGKNFYSFLPIIGWVFRKIHG